MNEQVKKLLHDAAKHVGRYVTPGNVQNLHIAINEKFAELIIAEHLRIMQQEWYDLNNISVDSDNESPRDVGLRVGRKNEVLVLMDKICKHSGVKE